ncbi:MAG: DeoR/GlpR transcriptional regulator [bacterium]|nr:DeoR/GlpR transcriptional regulator [bacterium]
MRSSERQSQMSAFLSERGYASLNEFVARFHVSVSTVRRDLEELQRRGNVRRTHGGAFPVEAREHPLDYVLRQTKQVSEKDAIGELAASLIPDGEAILLDGGTTTFRVAECLRDRHVQVVTSSLPIATLLGKSPETEVIFLGGSIMPRTGVALGPHAEQMLSSLRVRRAVMGVAGITEEGLFNANLLMVELEQQMITAAEEVSVVVDHSKFGRRSLVHLCNFSEVDQLITDAKVLPKWVELAKSHGVEVHLAEVAESPAEAANSGRQRDAEPNENRQEP